MEKTFLIDAHEDIAYNSLAYGRDYRRSASETRDLEKGTDVPAATGETLLGWEEYQQGQVALVFGTIFTVHRRYQAPQWGNYSYTNTDEAVHMLHSQIDYYRRLTDTSPDQFRLVTNRSELAEIVKPWQNSPAEYPQTTHPTGIVMSIESAEGIRQVEDIETLWNAGVRFIGPVWSGPRYCGGTIESGSFTSEGYRLLDLMMQFGFTLDLSHMNEKSALQAIERYEGCVIASHANVRALLKGETRERHFTDDVIHNLLEKDGVMGIIPFNHFLKPDWRKGNNREDVRLDMVLAHIDHICQMAGNAKHVGLGSDFDGGFGYPDVPLEINTIADLQKLSSMLKERGYSHSDIKAIFHGNWLRILNRTLPES